ncbi:MAG: rhodanese-like domain-containing protein [Pseudomonadales bacterium]
MLEQLIEFIGNHYLLVGLFAFLLVAFIVNESRRGGAAVSSSNLVTLVNREGALVVDVRGAKEYSAGHIAGALNLPLTNVEARLEELEPYKDKPVVLVCKMGQHAGAIGRKLKAHGFADVRRLSGGMAEWSASSLPVVK